MSPHRYARFYGKLTNLYIKMRETQTNCMEITQQESPKREGKREGEMEIGASIKL